MGKQAPATAPDGAGVVQRQARADEAGPQAAAMHARAMAAAQAGQPVEAERLLAECLRAAPSLAAARQDLAILLLNQNRLLEAADEADRLLDLDRGRAASLFLKGAISARLGRHEEAIARYTAGLAEQPSPRGWLSLGHALKAIGRLPDAVAAYRGALEVAPGFGEAWWSLANLKTERFTARDVAAMQRSLQSADLAAQDHCLLHFALGKAKEDHGEYAASFAHYAQGARLHRRTQHHAAEQVSAFTRRSKALLTAPFFAERQGLGCEAPDPIFVVGLPRAGSTLIEQILASHSLVEGTQELPEIMLLAGRLAAGEGGAMDDAYPRVLGNLPADRLSRLGEEYLEQTRVYRGSDRPFFVDKMPDNFMHLGLIHLILPNAKIIDARRHPLGCGFSIFKQHFAHGHTFADDLAEIGRHYADYVDLMAHFDDVLPGRVHRVIYEQMVADPEGEVRRLLEYCGLPFEDGCLQFHENDRAVRTPSSEQVRRPIFAEAVDHWRNYEPWLEPLKAALGPVLDAYPAPPKT